MELTTAELHAETYAKVLSVDGSYSVKLSPALEKSIHSSTWSMNMDSGHNGSCSNHRPELNAVSRDTTGLARGKIRQSMAGKNNLNIK